MLGNSRRQTKDEDGVDRQAHAKAEHQCSPAGGLPGLWEALTLLCTRKLLQPVNTTWAGLQGGTETAVYLRQVCSDERSRSQARRPTQALGAACASV